MKKRILPILFTAIFVCIFLSACNLKPACSHTAVTDAAVAPTCTQSGLTEGSHCSKCNAVITAQQPIPATHTGEWKTVVKPDCFYEGSEQRTCTVCDITETRKAANLEHKFVQDAETKLFACELCDGRIFKGHLYAAFNAHEKWYAAYKICNSLGGYLVSITSAEEQALLDDIINDNVENVTDESYYYWTSALLNTEWKWATGEDFSYTHWSSQEPDNEGVNQWHIGLASKTKGNPHAKIGEWEDIGHYEAHGYICEWDLGIEESAHFFSDWKTMKEADCFGAGERTRFCTHCGLTETETVAWIAHNFVSNTEAGFKICEHCSAAKYEGRIYKIFTNGLTWFSAQAYCDSISGHLVTITSAEEQAFVKNYMQKMNHSRSTWSGGYNDGASFQWVTDEAFEYTNWYTGQPDCDKNQEYFMEINIDNSRQWNDAPPNCSFAFICEWEAK